MATQRLIGKLGNDGKAFVDREPVPELIPGHLLVRVHASLVSPGTELAGVREARQGKALADPAKAIAFGYQNAGEVVAVASDVKRLKPGDRVACIGSGVALHGDYARVPQNLASLLPDNVTYEQGAFMNLALTAMNVIRRGELRMGEYVLCAGLGLVGQMTCRLAQIAGAYVMGWDMLEGRCQLARQWAAHETANPGKEDVQARAMAFTRGSGFDMAVLGIPGDVSRVVQTIKQVMKRSPDGHEMGSLCMVGGQSTQQWGAALGNLDLRVCSRTGPGYHDPDWETGRHAYPSALVRWHTGSHLELILRLISEGRFPVEQLITHRVALQDIDHAVALHVDQPESTMGVIITMPH